VSPNGEGMAQIKGFLVFVSDAKLGDHLKVKISNLNSISANAEIIARV